MKLNTYIDHTLLKTDATKADVEKLLAEAAAHNFASVCISPLWVKTAADYLAATNVAVCTVIGFPQGATPTSVKVYETEQAIRDGATEVDMVIAVGRLKEGDDDYVTADIAAVAAAAKGKALVKVIIEACLLTDDEKVRATKCVIASGADFVKTSTGFSTGGATLDDVHLLRRTAGDAIRVKAAGGIRDKETALAMIEAGADRLGTSAGVKLVEA
ncbi:deoxyribose-phosphate aldolase [Selenomonas sp. TAMA-11512]|uniref:deoxyribose-phosphate aldolase n=1 Tax=Selenomonas sp. TAMA-11512 TaxID=3095337 RepID=UPI00308659DA|nr:deoxyribose-phosphate aldolase [Selenomonas sp. TAMA-11512]